MFTNSAAYYDLIYKLKGKNYAFEAENLHVLIERCRRSPANTLLDVACGTGEHLITLQHYYSVEGLDVDPAMLAVARHKLPGVPFHQANMLDFVLNRQYDVLVCLFSSIGYLRSVSELRQGLVNMSRHISVGGLVIIEPWLSPDAYQVGTLHSVIVDQPDFKIARFNLNQVRGRLSVRDLHYLVATPSGVTYFTERHEMGLFTKEEYMDSFRAAGLDVTYDDVGPTGRGLYIGQRPPGKLHLSIYNLTADSRTLSEGRGMKHAGLQQR